jgi:hypothetical protein
MTDYIPQVDYTSKDYTSIKDDLLALIPNFAPNWTSRDSSDFGIVLLELFSYLGDLVNYQIDRAANESFITTATQRDNVLKLAALLGYSPNEISPATGTVSFTNLNANTPVIPKGTNVYSSGANPITYVTDSAVTLSAGPNVVTTATVTQGIPVTNEVVGNSDGTATQKFPLANTGVMPGSVSSSLISLTVNEVTYTRVSSVAIIDYASTDLVYYITTDGDGYTYVVFGDGVSGIIPPNGGQVKVSYKYSSVNGTLGNIPIGSIVSFDTTGISGLSATVANTAAFSGGTDIESTDSIRLNAPLALRTLNRAVSLSDYESLALTQSGISKAFAIASSFGAVSLFVAGDDASTVSTAQQAVLKTFFSTKTPPGTTLTVNSHVPAYPYISLAISVLPQYNAAAVQAQVQAAIYELFKYSNVSFNQQVTEGDIYATCLAVKGVNYVTISDMERLPAAPAVNGIYTQTAYTTATATSSTSTTTSITASTTTGIWTGAKIVTPTNLAGATIISVDNSTTFTLSTTSSAITIPSTTTITVTGSLGTSPGQRDLAFGYNEVPIYETSYVTVITSGGS